MTSTPAQWLKHHGITLTPAARRRFATVWEQAAEAHPDIEVRDAVLAAAATYLAAGSPNLRKLGDELACARAEVEQKLAAARTVAALAVEDGRTESSTARDLGVDRMAVRAWLGKR